MKKNAKLAPSQTPLRQVAIFLHNADFPHLRVTKLPPDSPAERCCFARPLLSVYAPHQQTSPKYLQKPLDFQNKQR